MGFLPCCFLGKIFVTKEKGAQQEEQELKIIKNEITVRAVGVPKLQI